MNEHMLLGAAILLLMGVLASKISDRFGVPALLLFLLLGMLAGSEGLGGIYFDDPAIARFVGVIGLVLILFAGGLDTEWQSIRPVLKEGLVLATAGVLLTAVVTGLFAHLFLDGSLLIGLLLGSVISSTDAAAVFSILRSKGIGLRSPLKPLLELESGSNDPMAVFLTVGLIRLITEPESSPARLVGLFVLQMLVGGAMGYALARLMIVLINRLRLGYEGLYPVLSLAFVFLTFGLTDLAGGSGFLAVYLAGLVLSRHDFTHKRSLCRFHDGLAWLMQVTMFLALGLLVFPSRLLTVTGLGLLLAGWLMFVARPLSVFVALLPSGFDWREKVFVSWVGLRGATPIILATFPLLAGIPQAELMFNVVFFVVLTSVLLQGTSIPVAARRLRVDVPFVPKREYPIEYSPMRGLKSELTELIVPPDSPVAGKSIVELGLPADFLVILVARGDQFLLPSGGTTLLAGDALLALSDCDCLDQVQARFGLRRTGGAL